MINPDHQLDQQKIEEMMEKEERNKAEGREKSRSGACRRRRRKPLLHNHAHARESRCNEGYSSCHFSLKLYREN